MAGTSSLAKELRVDIPLRSPITPPEVKPVKQPQQRHAGITTIEKLLMTLLVSAAFVLAVMCVSMEINILTMNRSLQDTTDKITVQQERNGDLTQEINELSRYDRVSAIAETAGLEMNEMNVRNVSE